MCIFIVSAQGLLCDSFYTLFSLTQLRRVDDLARADSAPVKLFRVASQGRILPAIDETIPALVVILLASATNALLFRLELAELEGVDWLLLGGLGLWHVNAVVSDVWERGCGWDTGLGLVQRNRTVWMRLTRLCVIETCLGGVP